ncbi:MAG: hypothetical protein AB7O50_15025 [Pseudolabrys sp.]
MTDLARLNQMSVEDLKPLLNTRLPEYGDFTVAEFFLNQDSRGEFPATSALAIEIARQLSDDSGLPLLAALDAVQYTGAIGHFAGHEGRRSQPTRRADTDFWVGVLGIRSDWGTSSREGWPVTGFGPGECWMKGHYDGTFDQVTAAIKSRMVRDTVDPDDVDAADHARLFMTNVSAAARRLSKRAKDLGIEINID